MFNTRLLLKLAQKTLNLRNFPLNCIRGSRENPIITMQNVIKPPACVKNMEILDRTKFTKEIAVPYITSDSKNVSKVLPILTAYLIRLENFKPVVNEGDTATIHLTTGVMKWNDLAMSDRHRLAEFGIKSLQFKTMTIQYENYSAQEVFRAVLPVDCEGMQSYTLMGHLAHVNLREHLLPFKSLIGEVLLEKIPNCRSVVNKINMIDNTYRNFQMELIAGEPDYNVEVKENRCRFQFDFSKVYWNSRLCTEHERLVNLVKEGEVVFDVFAGVGPFSVPLAKKKCTVYANDLNPESHKSLLRNAELNKCKDNLKIYNKDGKDFILQDFKAELLKHKEQKVHVIMNLPAIAVEFLQYFVGLYKNAFFKRPILLYVYCFAKGERPQVLAYNLIDQHCPELSDNIADIFKVRTVSSMKEMMRVTIKLDGQVLNDDRKRKLSEGESGATAMLNDEGETKHKLSKGDDVMAKKKNVFKVAGAKSLKAKTKAKPVKAQLKNTLKSVEQIDKTLSELHEKLITKTAEKKPTCCRVETLKKSAEDEVKKYEAAQKNSEAMMMNLNGFHLD